MKNSTGNRLSQSSHEDDRMHGDEDRFSKLPLHLLHHVLSFLPSPLVVQTCILSKSWKSIWCSVPYVDVVGCANVHISVDCLLHRRDELCSIKGLRIPVDYGWEVIHLMNSWIIYAIKHHVEVLDLDIAEGPLTSQIFSSMSLRELKLFGFGSYGRQVSLFLPASICLPALRVLHLSNVKFEKNGQLEELLYSILPSLESLILEKCAFENLSTICAPKLKTLRLQGDFPLDSIDISCPNLASLKLKPRREIKSIRFQGTFSHIIDVNIQLRASSLQLTSQLIKLLLDSPCLTLSSKFLSSFAISLKRKLSIRSELCNLRRLNLLTTFSDDELLAIYTILKHSPLVQSLLLNKNEDEPYEDDDSTDEDSDDNSDYPLKDCHTLEPEGMLSNYKLSHLKLVEINGFRAYGNEVELIRVLLEKAPDLETVIITASRNENRKVLVETCQKLLKAPRASSKVGIFFE